MNINEINIRENANTHGYCCDFYINDKKFYAEVSDVMFYGPECMIFKYNDDNSVNWQGIYCDRSVEVTEESLLQCIKEFAEQEC